MKRFISLVLVFSGLICLLLVWVFSWADGHSDPYYLRFTTSKQSDLILGTSKAAQGLQPTVIDEVLGTSMFNYSFTVGTSPFGDVYFNSIKKKLNKGGGKSTYIITIDPWSISSKRLDPNDSSVFRENTGFLNNVPYVNLNPNPFYLLRAYNGRFGDLIEKQQQWYYLHDNGWLEVFAKIDSISLINSRKRNLDSWIESNEGKYFFSEYRLRVLGEMIEYLGNFGEVYLVRLPVSEKMLTAENKLMHDFDSRISQVIEKSNGYLDLTDRHENFVFHDGIHLYKNSGETVSKIIAEWIQQHRK